MIKMTKHLETFTLLNQQSCCWIEHVKSKYLFSSTDLLFYRFPQVTLAELRSTSLSSKSSKVASLVAARFVHHKSIN